MEKKKLEALEDMLCDELTKIADKGALNSGDLDAVHKLTESIKNIMKVEDMGVMDDYSQRGYSRRYSQTPYMMNGNSAYEGDSYGRHWVRGHYSRSGSVADRIEEMMEDGSLNQQDRNVLQKALNQLR